jgi:hypothetical protein
MTFKATVRCNTFIDRAISHSHRAAAELPGRTVFALGDLEIAEN